MRDAQPGAVYLKDYQPPAYLINRTELHFELYEDHALVSSRLYMLRSGEVDCGSTLELHGEELELLSVALDGVELSSDEYHSEPGKLLVHDVPEQFILSCRTRIRPQDNTSLEGLFKSSTMF